MMIRSGPREDKSLAQFVTIALDGCTDGADVSRAGLHDGQARPDLVYVGAVLFPVETDMPAVSADQDDGGLFDEQSFGGERRGPSVPEHAVFRGLAYRKIFLRPKFPCKLLPYLMRLQPHAPHFQTSPSE